VGTANLVSDALAARLTLLALDMIDQAQAQQEAGASPRDVAERINETASLEVLERIVILRGGMMIGEVPRPTDEGWRDFVENQRDHVARIEAAERDGS
jgi:hypothetical protein